MAKPKKDGKFFNMYIDRNLLNRLEFYADSKGQSKTTAVELILKKHFDESGVPEVINTEETDT